MCKDESPDFDRCPFLSSERVAPTPYFFAQALRAESVCACLAVRAVEPVLSLRACVTVGVLLASSATRPGRS